MPRLSDDKVSTMCQVLSPKEEGRMYSRLLFRHTPLVPVAQELRYFVFARHRLHHSSLNLNIY